MAHTGASQLYACHMFCYATLLFEKIGDRYAIRRILRRNWSELE